MRPKSAQERLEDEPGSPPITVAAEPRIFGMVPPEAALGLGCVGLVLGVVLIAAGQLPVAVAVLVFGSIFLALAIDAIRRWPSSRLAQAVVGFLDGVGSRLGFARVFAGAWSEAAREIVRCRRELGSLRDERDREQYELGGAAYRDEKEEADVLRERIGQLEDSIERVERDMQRAIDDARNRVDRERVAIRPTEPFAVAEPRRGTTDLHPRNRR